MTTKISRRQFLFSLGAAVAGALVGGVVKAGDARVTHYYHDGSGRRVVKWHTIAYGVVHVEQGDV